MSGLGGYYLGLVLRPGRTFERLLSDPNRLRLGIEALAINAFLYTLVYVFLTMGGGAPSSFTPWLAIPLDEYYSYNRFMLAPSMVLGWIFAAGLAQLISRAVGGRGSFEDMLSVFGFGIGVACAASLLHDLPDSFLGAVGLLDLRAYEVLLNTPTIWRAILLTLYGLSGLLFLLLFTKGVLVAQRLRAVFALPIGIVAYAGYQVVFFVFNR